MWSSSDLILVTSSGSGVRSLVDRLGVSCSKGSRAFTNGSPSLALKVGRFWRQVRSQLGHGDHDLGRRQVYVVDCVELINEGREVLGRTSKGVLISRGGGRAQITHLLQPLQAQGFYLRREGL